MANHLNVKLDAAPDDLYAIVVATYYESITNKLVEGALEALGEHGVAGENILVVPVPGSFEIPTVAQALAAGGRFTAICCLGVVIEGETEHHEYINREVAAGIRQAGQQTGVPVTFGVLTCRSREQAIARAGGDKGNKGTETALAALQLVATLRQLEQDNHL